MEEQNAQAYWQENIRIPCGAGVASARKWLRPRSNREKKGASGSLFISIKNLKQDSKNGDYYCCEELSICRLH